VSLGRSQRHILDTRKRAEIQDLLLVVTARNTIRRAVARDDASLADASAMLDRVLKSSCPHNPATWHTAPTATGELLTSEDYRRLTPYEGNWWRGAALLVTGYTIPDTKGSAGVRGYGMTGELARTDTKALTESAPWRRSGDA
jgi:hypothetical protein